MSHDEDTVCPGGAGHLTSGWPRVLVALTACVALGALVLSRLDATAVSRTFVHMSLGWALGAALIHLSTVGVEAWRWKLILSSVTQKTSVWTALSAILVGTVANGVLPAKAGEAVRAYVVARKAQLPVATVFSTVILDRGVDIAWFLLPVALAAWLVPLPGGVIRVVMLIVAVIGAALVLPALLGRLRHRLASAARSRVSHGVRTHFRNFGQGFRVLLKARRIVPVSRLAFLVWALRLLVIWVMFGAVGIGLGVGAALVVLVLVNVGIVSLSMPANIGAFELSVVAALRLFPVSTEAAVGYAVALHLIELVPTTLLGLIILFAARGQLSLWRIARVSEPPDQALAQS